MIRKILSYFSKLPKSCPICDGDLGEYPATIELDCLDGKYRTPICEECEEVFTQMETARVKVEREINENSTGNGGS